VIALVIVVLMAFACDLVLLTVQRFATPWRRAAKATA
jgi:hypothetical protein